LPPVDVIAVSNSSYNFEYNDTPWTFTVWNSNPLLMATLDFAVSTNQSWLLVTPKSGSSDGSDPKNVITVTVNRTNLAKGTHTGTITISGQHAISKQVKITVYSQGDIQSSGGWTLANVSRTYSPPSLLEFDFSLRDENDHAVQATPTQFAVKCLEDGEPIGPETDSHFARGSNKQLLAYLVLDYTKSMTDRTINGDLNHNGISDAIDYMQDAAKNVFLNALNPDAKVGIYEFHRGDRDPVQIAGFSTDKEYLKDAIDGIRPAVSSFLAESRCWDALFAAASQFSTSEADMKDEQRAIVFLSDGRDEASTHTYQDVVNRAKQRGIALYSIGFGAELDLTTLQLLSSQTKGQYYSASTVDQLGAQFQQIVNDLGGQYILRWATLQHTAQPFTPSFEISIAGHTLTYTAPTGDYKPVTYAGDRLHGDLRVVASENGQTTTAFLRAVYMPRYITEIVFDAVSPYPFTVHLVNADDGGLCDPAEWQLTASDSEPAASKHISIRSAQPGD
ncbi:MAG: VWA domain-containing protein, partial [Candidatus Hydrogenedentes bacterium]|nr:VWA domain-containing protein [Candidatus Hydrogenedentota bacterium]